MSCDCPPDVEVTVPTTNEVEVVPPVEHQVDITLPVHEVEITPPETHEVEVEVVQTQVIEVPTCGCGPGLQVRVRWPFDEAIDGVRTTFTVSGGLNYVHNGVTDEQLLYNGVVQDEGPGCDYTAVESGGAGTGFDTVELAFAPRIGDNLAITFYLA